MRKITDESLINDYINGVEINDYTLDFLEDSYAFMTRVMEVTNDKLMYNFTSDRLKKDYDFVKFVVHLFDDDYEFITRISDDYIKENENDVTSRELEIILTNIIKDEDKKMLYAIKADIFYISNRDIILSEYSVSVLREYGIFYIMASTYPRSKEIQDYLAKKLISSYFSSEIFNLEENIHLRFNSFEDLEKYGITTYILDLIREKDSYLMDYVCVNQDLIDIVKEKIKYIGINWYKYIDNVNYHKMLMFYSFLIKYNDDFLENVSLVINYDKLLKEVIISLGLSDFFAKYDITEQIDFNIDEDIDVSNVINIEEIMYKQGLINYMENLFIKDNSSSFSFKTRIKKKR